MGSELVKPHHLGRLAVIYVRQSTPHQVLTNQESLRLQYALRQRARELGWHEADIDVIDADLGLSGAAATHRQGFKELVARVTLGEVGLIGPAPWEWRGEIRTSRGCADGNPFHAEPRLDRGAIAEGRVQTLPVVEDLDVVEHGCLGLLPGAEPGLVDMLLLQRGEEALHRRVVEAVAAPAHGLPDPVPLQHSR